MLARDRIGREIKPPDRYGYADLIAIALIVASEVLEDEPTSVKVALASKEKDKWQFAMEEGMKSLYDNNTQELIRKTIGLRVVSCKWLFKRKEGLKGVELDNFKARLVARGSTQKEAIEFNEVFSPVVKHRSIKLLLAMVIEFDLELEQIGVKRIFLFGEIDETILMRQPGDLKSEAMRIMFASFKGSFMA